MVLKRQPDELGNVKLNYNASQDSSQVQEQIDILNQAIAKKTGCNFDCGNESDALEAQMIKARMKEFRLWPMISRLTMRRRGHWLQPSPQIMKRAARTGC